MYPGYTDNFLANQEFRTKLKIHQWNFGTQLNCDFSPAVACKALSVVKSIAYFQDQMCYLWLGCSS